MVYEGRPSRGCKNCKKSHAKCDEARPACSLCVRKKLVCPGYKSDFDLVLRDQTSFIRDKEQRRQCGRETNSPPNSLFESADVPPVSDVKVVQAFPVPRSLAVTPEHQAICYFFSSYILIKHRPEASRGYLEQLLPIYTYTKHDSLLSIATTATALAVLGSRPGMSPLLQMGRTAFGRALFLTNKSLHDPVESKKDETLLAVLLLGMAEDIIALADTTEPSRAHTNGAIALLRLRGKDNFNNEIAKSLFLAVRTEMVNTSLRKGVMVKATPIEWLEDIGRLSLSAASRLTEVTASVANLQASANRAFRREPQAVFDDTIESVLTNAMKADEALTDWESSVPDDWHPQPASNTLPKELYKYGAYGSDMDIYLEVWVASIWNSYRSQRITVLSTIVTCLTRKAGIGPKEYCFATQGPVSVIQQMVDNICASVPFHLGNRTLMDVTEEVEYPWIQGSTVSADHRKAALNLGGWFLIGPLSACLKVSFLAESQRQWIIAQIGRIKYFYNIRG